MPEFIPQLPQGLMQEVLRSQRERDIARIGRDIGPLDFLGTVTQAGVAGLEKKRVEKMGMEKTMLDAIREEAEKEKERAFKVKETEKAQAFEFEKIKAQNIVPADETIRQSYEIVTGKPWPQEQVEIDKRLADSFIDGAARIKLGGQRHQLWIERIGFAKQNKDLPALLKYRDEISKEINLTLEQKMPLLNDIDTVIKGEIITPKLPQKLQTPTGSPSLPGLEIYE